MGGKTQQRVAGNVKPTSSRRIRELMINKQQGLGNIITFSTLANNPPPAAAGPPSPNKQASQELEKQEPPIPKVEDKLETLKDDKDEPASKQGSPSDGKTTLIVKRVGNRDYFTRVKVAKDSSLESGLSIKSGVHRFPESQPQQLVSSSSIIRDDDDESKQDEDEDDISQATEPSKSSFDFDTLLTELTKIQDNWDKTNNSAVSLNDLSESQISQEYELIKLLRILVKEFKIELSIEEWDLVVQSIYKWTCLITKTDNLLENVDWTLFCINVFKFIHELILSAKLWNEKGEDPDIELPMMGLLAEEWNNFHSSKVYQDLILLYFKLISEDSNSKVLFTDDAISIIQALANIILEVDPKSIIMNDDISKIFKNITIEFDPYFKTPENYKFCEIDTETKFKSFLPICNLLKSNHRVIIVTAHSMLSKVMDKISESISDIIKDGAEDLESISLMPPKALMALLTSKDSIMTALLSDYKVGDISVTIEPNTDSYTCTLSYLFIWDLIIQFIVGMNKEDGHRLIHCLKKLGFIPRLLDNIFMLLPPLGERDSLRFGVEEHFGHKRATSSINLQHSETWYLMEYLKSPLKTSLVRPKNEIELTALHVYFSIALHMPVTVRKWFNNNSNKRLSNLVNEYTVKHISQVICSLEMESVQDKCQERANEDKSNNLYIKARPNAREVHAVYTRDEFKMELTIKLPINYPLGSVQIDGGKRVAVTDLKWRSWLLQLTTFLSHQNGPILDGIDLWRKNIDKRFEGIDKCMICFSILHSNYQLPRKRCMTCTKMFHNLCLYKWFESSGNATCPHCRSMW